MTTTRVAVVTWLAAGWLGCAQAVLPEALAGKASPGDSGCRPWAPCLLQYDVGPAVRPRISGGRVAFNHGGEIDVLQVSSGALTAVLHGDAEVLSAQLPPYPRLQDLDGDWLAWAQDNHPSTGDVTALVTSLHVRNLRSGEQRLLDSFPWVSPMAVSNLEHGSLAWVRGGQVFLFQEGLPQPRVLGSVEQDAALTQVGLSGGEALVASYVRGNGTGGRLTLRGWNGARAGQVYVSEVLRLESEPSTMALHVAGDTWVVQLSGVVSSRFWSRELVYRRDGRQASAVGVGVLKALDEKLGCLAVRPGNTDGEQYLGVFDVATGTTLKWQERTFLGECDVDQRSLVWTETVIRPDGHNPGVYFAELGDADL